MKLTDVGSAAHEVEPYLSNSSWLLQQKFDGTRIQAQWSPTGEILFSNDGVKPVTHAAAKLKLPALEAELTPLFKHIGHDGPVTLEGELLIRTGEFVVWDLLVGSDPSQWASTILRTHMVRDLFAELAGQMNLVSATPTAFTESQKRALWELINASNVEGAVSKHHDSPYVPGARSTQWVKHKLVKTADLVVMTAERTFKPEGPGRPANTVVHKGSASLGYVDPASSTGTTFIAAASLIGRDLTIAPGDVVEVAYLYREPDGGLVQPRILRKRWDAVSGTGDKEPRECTVDQFPVYSRAVL
jgi:hypothetical protein